MSISRRFVSGAELRVGQSEGDESALVLSGRAVGYNRLSLPGIPARGCRERIAPGAFRDSLAVEPVTADFNHSNEFLTLGTTKNRTLQLDDKADGLYFRINLNSKVQVHRDLHELVKAGTLSECSFSFGEPEDSWSDEIDDEDRSHYSLRTVKRAKLYGISIVAAPAYSDGATNVQARSIAYAFGRPAKPLTTTEARALRVRCADIARRMKQDEATFIAEQGRQFGFKQVRVGPGESDFAFLPMTAEESLEHLKRRAAVVGAEIREQHLQYLREQIERERRSPSGTFDPEQRCMVPTLELLEKELASYGE